MTATDLTRQQGKRLQRVRETRGLSRPLIADRLGFRSSQTVELYERGVSVIRMDQLPRWADAFEMSRQDFAEAVLGEAAPDPTWTFRAALRGHLPEALIEQLAQTWEGRPLVNQQAAVEALIEMAEELRVENTPHDLRTPDAQAM